MFDDDCDQMGKRFLSDRLPPALLTDVQQHLEGLVFGPASQQPLNLTWSPPRFVCAATAYTTHPMMHSER